MAPPTYNVAPPLTKPSLFFILPFFGPTLKFKLLQINLYNFVTFKSKSNLFSDKKKNPIFLNDISLNPQSNPKSPCF